jgi:hypothetical protein
MNDILWGHRMIRSTLPVDTISKKEPSYDPKVLELSIPPLQRVQYFSPDEYEDFISEWAISCAKPIYKDAFRIGSAGDMGRDVIGEYEDGSYDYYQCKRYKKKLAPSQYWLEIGKLCYYTFNNDIPMPKKYYIVLAIHKKQPKLKSAKMVNVNIPHEQRRTENEKTRSISARIA